MNPADLLRLAAENFTSLGIRFFVTGSMATITYGEPRFTNDVDIVARIKLTEVEKLCDRYPAPEFYCSRDAVIEAVETLGMFNIIHPTSGLKLDIMIPADDAFNESRFERRRFMMIDEKHSVPFASPEDVILKKLMYFQSGGSEKHLRDIRGVFKLQQENLDFDYLNTWATQLGVLRELEQVLKTE